MITPINYNINRAELIGTLRLLSPFIVIQKMENDEDDDKSEIMLPEPYFYDKVTFILYKAHASLSVLTKEGVRVERTCNIESNFENVSFCMPHAYLLQEVAKVIHEAEIYSFVEDRFFGFNVYDAISSKYLFDVDAHSVRKQPPIHPKCYFTLYPKTVSLEHETLLKVLKVFSNYTQEDCLRPFYESIWLCFNNGVCRALATNGSTLRQEIFQTKEMGNHMLSIPGKYAKRFYDIIVNWKEYTCHQILYNDSYLRLYDFNREGGIGETIEAPLNKSKLPDIERVLAKHNIIHSSSLHLDDLKSALRMMNTMKYKDEYVIMHFFSNHVNMHCQDEIENKKVSEFYDTLECDGEHILRLNQKKLETILDEVYTDNVIFTLTDDNILYINNDDEELFGGVIRILCTAKMRDEDQEFLERGDEALRSHQYYIDKYLAKNDEND